MVEQAGPNPWGIMTIGEGIMGQRLKEATKPLHINHCSELLVSVYKCLNSWQMT